MRLILEVWVIVSDWIDTKAVIYCWILRRHFVISFHKLHKKLHQFISKCVNRWRETTQKVPFIHCVTVTPIGHRNNPPEISIKTANMMAWCHQVPNHWLHQCWLALIRFKGIHLHACSMEILSVFFQRNKLWQLHFMKRHSLFLGSSSIGQNQPCFALFGTPPWYVGG